MYRSIQQALGLCALLVFATCAPDNQKNATSPPIDELTQTFLDGYMQVYRPDIGTVYQYPGVSNHRFPDYSPEGRKAYENFTDSVYAEVSKVDTTGLEATKKITYTNLKRFLEAEIAQRVCNSHWWSLNPMDGFPASLIPLAERQSLSDSVGKQQLLSRWADIPRFLRQEIANHKEGLENGYSVPATVVQSLLQQLDMIQQAPPEMNPLYYPANRVSDTLFRNALSEEITTSILPAVAEYATYIKEDYLPKARKTYAVTDLPDGSACYKAMLQQYAWMETNPDVILTSFQEALAADDAYLKERGTALLGTSDKMELMQSLSQKLTTSFPSAETRKDSLQVLLLKARNATENYFGMIPKKDVILQPMDPLVEATRPPTYIPSPTRSQDPSLYLYPSRRFENINRGAEENTLFHEVYPGHHLHASWESEMPQVNSFTKSLIANRVFVEGWAAYAEELAHEMGLYSSEEAYLYTLVNNSNLYAGIGDIGLHYKGWTRKELHDFINESAGAEMPESVVVYIMNRLAVQPGQGVTYSLGDLYFQRLRQQAEDALGDDFNSRAFHFELLKYGSMPMDVLEERMAVWIEDRK